MFPCTWPTIAQCHCFVIVYLLSEHLLPTIQRQGLDLGHWCLVWCLTSKSQSRTVAERVNEEWMSLSSHLPNCVTAYTNHPFIIQRASLQRRTGLFLTRLCVLSTQYMTCSQSVANEGTRKQGPRSLVRLSHVIFRDISWQSMLRRRRNSDVWFASESFLPLLAFEQSTAIFLSHIYRTKFLSRHLFCFIDRRWLREEKTPMVGRVGKVAVY